MQVNGATLAPDSSGGLWWAAERTLVFSDLHLEKASSLARRGYGLLPPYDTRATLAAIAAAISRYAPARVICLGDNFHDEGGSARLHPADREALVAMVAARDWIWLAGNHDPGLDGNLGGQIVEELHLGPLVFRHEPLPGIQPGEIAGHLHPKASVTVTGAQFTRRCFASDGHRVVMPAFGAFTGGLDLSHKAFRGLFRAGLHAWILGDRTVHRFPVRHGGFR